MYRVITAASSINELDDAAVLNLLGRSQYDQLYKAACRKIDEEIYNRSGDVEIRWTNGGCTATTSDNEIYTIMSHIYADYTTELGDPKSVYAETRVVYDSLNPSRYFDPTVVAFDDEIEYQ